MSQMSMKKQILGLIAWLGASYAAAGLGSVATLEAGAFYSQLVRPSWSPPAWVFGPVWSVLFTLMGIAAWWVWRVEGFRAARVALGLFIVQLVFNALWSWLFFRWRLGGPAFGEIVVLWVAILANLIAFWRVRVLAGALLLPYLLWVGFAALLNLSLWRLNPDILG